MRSFVLLCAWGLGVSSAHAFCGFYIKEDATHLTSRASRVVLLRDGTTTVLSMQSTYEGPPEDFALIIPVPEVLGPNDVKTLDPEVFDRVDQLTSPRLVEYWEQEPFCADGGFGAVGYGMGGGFGRGGRVSVHAQFAVGEYDIVILGADESTALEQWLTANGYRLPDGARDALRPYVQQGMKFFAAKVSSDRVTFHQGKALLSPLRMVYESPELMLPVRLGMLNSPGEQDLIVYVVSRDGRFEVANRPNVTVPTNLVVSPSVRGRFTAFYDALLDRVWETTPGAVVTEYAWEATSCDPCPGPTMSADDITTLGGDVASGAVETGRRGYGMSVGPVEEVSGRHVGARLVSRWLSSHSGAIQACLHQSLTTKLELDLADGRVVDVRAQPMTDDLRCIVDYLRGTSIAHHTASKVSARIHIPHSRPQFVQTSARGFTLTRMRYRYGRSAPASDLVFRRASPIIGGVGEPDENGELQQGPREGTFNTFQPRYAILHPWHGRLGQCENVVHSGWGGPPNGENEPRTAGALDGIRTRRPVNLRRMVRTPVPALGLPGRRPARSGAAVLPLAALAFLAQRRWRKRR